jgi:hypothetical protein
MTERVTHGTQGGDNAWMPGAYHGIGARLVRDETISLVRRSHPETDQCSIRSLNMEKSYGRGRRGSRCLVQHQRLRASCL